MSFEFENQTPVGTYDFMSINKGLVDTLENVKISFVESYKNENAVKPLVLLDIGLSFQNSKLKYPSMLTSIHADYIGSDKVRFSNNHLRSYLFMRDILIHDRIMDSGNCGAIINTIPEIKEYLKNKELLLNIKKRELFIDGQVLKYYGLHVIDTV